MVKRQKKKLVERLRKGEVWYPSPLAIDEKGKFCPGYQRLVILYAIRSGARTVIPGTHTGEFAGKGVLPERAHLQLYTEWLTITKEMTLQYGNEGMFLMSAVSDVKEAEIAAKTGYEIVMVSPKPFSRMGRSIPKYISYCKKIASIIPVFGFYLQPKVGGVELPTLFWQKLFDFAYGAKVAPFDRYRTLQVLEAAAKSPRGKELVLVTGNDDHIVGDLRREFAFYTQPLRNRLARTAPATISEIGGSGKIVVEFKGGLLGHFATDTFSAVKWTRAVLRHKKNRNYWPLRITIDELEDAVTSCNNAIFDAAPGNFENCIWGIKYRLTKLGLLKGPYSLFREKGRRGQAKEIDAAYEGEYRDVVSDSEYLKENLGKLKREVGV